MFNSSKLAESVRLAIALGAAASLSYIAPSIAQEESADSLEKITITGSRIVRDEFASSSPISVFNQEDLVNSGVTNLDEFLKFVPAFTGFQLGATTNNGNAAGQRKIDMRGLDFNRTLVLINGRRHVGDVNDDGAVDLNAIPFSMVKRIEVLKDGASTIYGTDAIAGVVNVILHDDFEGIQLTADWGQSTEHGDAINKSISIMMGTASDKGSLTMALEYTRQDELLQGDREWAQDSLYSLLQDDGSFEPIPSGSSNSRRIRGINGLPGNYIVDETTGEVRAFSSGDTYNFAPVNALVTPNERWQFAANGRLEVNDKINVYTETLYTRRTSQQRLAPDASFGVTSSYRSLLTGQDQFNDLVPASNPFNPFGDNANNSFGISGESVRVNRRFEESGGRITRVTGDTFRMVTGLEAEIVDDIFFDISYTYAQNEFITDQRNLHRFDRWETIVTPELCDVNPDCAAAGVLDPFGPFGSITDDQMAFLTAGSLKNVDYGQLGMLQVNLSGDFMELDGGSIGWAVGYEKRRERGEFIPDEFLAEGLTTGGATDPQEGSFAADEIYAELYLPIFDNLAVDVSARYSDYDTVGDTFNYKIGVDWSITDEFKLRSGFATGFRAPNISELNQQQTADFPVAESLCEFSDRRTDITDTIRQNCLDLIGPNGTATGADGTDYTGADGEFGFAWQSTYTGFAPEDGALEPEESETITFGLVYESQAVEGLLVSVDYWDIEVDNLIDLPDYNNLLRNCLDSVNLSSPSCDLFVGGPYSSIFPNDAETAFGNLGLLETSGIDFEAQYSFGVDLGLFNQISLMASGTYLLERTETFELSGVVELEGTADSFAVFPELRTNLGIRFSGDDLTLGWDIFYISETDDLRRPAEITSDAVAESIVYHDIFATYNFAYGSVTLGLNNVTDEDPPYFHSAFNANTDPGVYDVIGRRVFFNTRITF